MSNNIYDRYGFQESDFSTPKRETFDMAAVKEGAVLFLYGPTTNKFGKTALYSRTYNFDSGSFAHNLNQVVDSVVNTSGGSVASVGRGVNPYEQFTYTQRRGKTLEGNLISSNWTFTLIFTGKSNRIRSDILVTTTAIGGMDRTIYTGVCSDVPYISQGGRDILNDKCVLEVLHKNKTSIDATSNRLGTTYDLRNKYSDHVFNERLFSDLTTSHAAEDQVDHHLSPAKVALGVRSQDGNFYTVGGLSTEIKVGAKVVTSDLTDDPKEHLSAITRGVGEFLKFQEHSKSIFGDADWVPQHDGDNPDYVSDQFSASLHIPTSGNHTEADLDLTGRVTLGDLDKNFELQVHGKTFENSSMYSADSETDSIINRLAYELGIITAIVMNRLGISSVLYVYSVEEAGQNFVRENFSCRRAGYIYQIDREDGQRLRDLLEVELRQGILKKIRSALGGDYHVSVNASISDVTTIRLNPLGMANKNPVDYVIPNILGGLVSATIGSTQDSHHNVGRLCDLLETFSGAIDPDMIQRPRSEPNRGIGGNNPPRDADNWDSTYEPAMERPVSPEPERPAAAPVAPRVTRDWDNFN